MKIEKNFLKNIISSIFFCLIYSVLLILLHSKYYFETIIYMGFIGYFLLFLYFLFFNKPIKNIFLFIFSNFLNIFCLIFVFDFILTECFYFSENEILYKFYTFSIFKIFPFFITGIITEFLFYKNNRQLSKNVYKIITNKIFRYLIILNIGSLIIYIINILLISVAKGLFS